MRSLRLLVVAAVAFTAACSSDYESPTAVPAETASPAVVTNPVFQLTGLNGGPVPNSATLVADEYKLPDPQVLSFVSRYAAFSFLGPLRVTNVQYLSGGQLSWLGSTTTLKSAFQMDLIVRSTRSLPQGLYKARMTLTWAGVVNYFVDVTFTVGFGPSPGNDVVVFNDVNQFDNTGMANPNNVLMVQNLVGYTASGPRNAGKTVWWDTGRNSQACYGECSVSHSSTMASVITNLGYTITQISSTSGSLTSIPAGVKVIFLWMPMVAYTNTEINALKAFANEGGRIVMIGEWDGFYGPQGIATENDFLLKMGAVMTNVGNAVDCGFNTLPGTSLRPHQVTTGMTDVTMACASVIVPGPNDYPLYYDKTNTKVLAGVAKIDPTPLPALGNLVPADAYRRLPTVNSKGTPGLNAKSSTGR